MSFLPLVRHAALSGLQTGEMTAAYAVTSWLMHPQSKYFGVSFWLRIQNSVFWLSYPHVCWCPDSWKYTLHPTTNACMMLRVRRVPCIPELREQNFHLGVLRLLIANHHDFPHTTVTYFISKGYLICLKKICRYLKTSSEENHTRCFRKYSWLLTHDCHFLNFKVSNLNRIFCHFLLNK